MFKKFALFATILFSCTNASFALTDKEIEAVDKASLTFIKKLEKTIDSKHSVTLSEMLDWFTDENGNNAHEIMADFYLNNLEKTTPISYKEAFITLALLANKIAQHNIDTRPYTAADLTKFIASNNQLIQFIKNQAEIVLN